MRKGLLKKTKMEKKNMQKNPLIEEIIY